jgi:hypothetical protein
MVLRVLMEGDVLLFSTLLINPFDSPVASHICAIVIFFLFLIARILVPISNLLTSKCFVYETYDNSSKIIDSLQVRCYHIENHYSYLKTKWVLFFILLFSNKNTFFLTSYHRPFGLRGHMERFSGISTLFFREVDKIRS